MTKSYILIRCFETSYQITTQCLVNSLVVLSNQNDFNQFQSSSHYLVRWCCILNWNIITLELWLYSCDLHTDIIISYESKLCFCVVEQTFKVLSKVSQTKIVPGQCQNWHAIGLCLWYLTERLYMLYPFATNAQSRAGECQTQRYDWRDETFNWHAVYKGLIYVESNKSMCNDT